MRRLMIVTLALAAMWSGPAWAPRRAEVTDQKDLDAKGSDDKPLDLARTRAAILAGATKLNFKVKKDEPGLVTVEYRERKGRGATIDVPYTAGKYSILYASSDGMRFTEHDSRRTILGGYAGWARNLAMEIGNAAKSDLSGAPPPPGLAGAARTPSSGVNLQDLPLQDGK